MIQTKKSLETFYPRIGLFLLLGGALACFFLLPFGIWGDGNDRYQFMDTLIHQQRILPMRFSMIGSLISYPLWLISGFLKDNTRPLIRVLLVAVPLLIGNNTVEYLSVFRFHGDYRRSMAGKSGLLRVAPVHAEVVLK